MSYPSLRDNLISTEVGDELLVFVGESSKAICLGATGKAVFLACRDSVSPEELAQTLLSLGASDPKITLEETLNQLTEEGLLQPAASSVQFDRRRFMAAAGALAIPVLASAIAPRPVAAASCTLCPVDASGVPNEGGNAISGCATCGTTCSLAAFLPCNTLICNFEYVLFSTTPASPTTDCQTIEGAAAQYRCRSTAGVQYDPSCATARANALAAGLGVGGLYYCCNCNTNPGPNRQSCP